MGVHLTPAEDAVLQGVAIFCLPPPPNACCDGEPGGGDEHKEEDTHIVPLAYGGPPEWFQGERLGFICVHIRIWSCR